MKLYLHLADTGLVLADLSVRLYDAAGGEVSAAGLTLSALATATDYELDGLPDVPATRPGLTLTTEYPAGVFSPYRFGTSETQPLGVIIPIREILADPLTDLAVKVFQDGAAINPGLLTVEQIGVDGEYLVSGWNSPFLLGEQWAVRWQYEGAVYAVQWIGTAQANLTSPGVLEAVESAVIAAGLDFPVRVANQRTGHGFLGGVSVPLPTGPTAEWCEVTMPRLTEDQITSGGASALFGTPRPEPLLHVRYFGPSGKGAVGALNKVRTVANLFAGTTVGGSLGGAQFFKGVSTVQLGVGPSATIPGAYFQAQATVRGLLLFQEAA